MLVAEFKRFCDFTPEAYLLVRTDGAIEAANQAAADWLGEPLSGTRIADRTEDPDAAAAYLELSARSRDFLPGACRLRTRRGIEDCRTWAAFVDKSPGGTFVLLRLEPRGTPNRFGLLNEHIRALNQEIADRKRAEQQIAADREWFRTTLASIGDGVIVTDAGLRVAFMNPAAEQLTGWPFHDAEGQPLSKVFQLRGTPPLLIRRDGTAIPVDDCGSPVRAASGETGGSVLVFRDVSERRRQEQELRLTNRRLQQASESLRQFAFAAAHDLKEPLRGVSIFAELLNTRYRDTLDGRGAQYLEFVRSSANRMQMFADGLASFIHAADDMDTPLEDVDCNEAARSALEQCRDTIARTGARVRIQTLPAVRAHRRSVEHLLRNLLQNALQYAHPGIPADVELDAEQEGPWVRISVRDRGIGIHPDYHEQIFDLFKRLDRATPGAGIGLSVCERIVENYGGRIWVESAAGEGASFHFLLPSSRQISS